jgi:hypothetical protein
MRTQSYMYLVGHAMKDDRKDKISIVHWLDGTMDQGFIEIQDKGNQRSILSLGWQGNGKSKRSDQS